MRRTRCTRRQRKSESRTATNTSANVAIRLGCHSRGQLFFARDEREPTAFARVVVRGVVRRDVVALRREAVDFDRVLVDFRLGAADLDVAVLRRRAAVVFDFAFERAVVAFRLAVDLARDVVALRFAVVVFRFVVDLARDVVAFRFAVDLARDVVALRFAVDFVRDVVAFRFAVDFDREVVAFRFVADFAFAVDLRFDVPDFAFERDDDDFVPPACARCLVTARAAISSARSMDSPFSLLNA
jgi:hypothetical protein